jgi:hypothetical protein
MKLVAECQQWHGVAESVTTCKFISFFFFSSTRQTRRKKIGAILFRCDLCLFCCARGINIKIVLRQRIVLVRYCANIDGLLLLLAFPTQWTFFGCHAKFLKSFHTLLLLFDLHLCNLNKSNSLFSHNYSNLRQGFTVAKFPERVSRVVEGTQDTMPTLRPIVKLITCAMNRVDSSATSVQMPLFSSSVC